MQKENTNIKNDVTTCNYADLFDQHCSAVFHRLQTHIGRKVNNVMKNSILTDTSDT